MNDAGETALPRPPGVPTATVYDRDGAELKKGIRIV
jgi:hypothetical protein